MGKNRDKGWEAFLSRPELRSILIPKEEPQHDTTVDIRVYWKEGAGCVSKSGTPQNDGIPFFLLQELKQKKHAHTHIFQWGPYGQEENRISR